MSGRALLLASALTATLAALPAGSAGAASWLEMNFYLSGPRYEGVLPPCNHAEPLRKIASRFNQKENMYWNTDLAIVGFGRIRETAFRTWAPNTIPRRFCSGSSRSRTEPSTPSTIRSPRIPAGSAQAGASNGAWSGSTATGPTIRPARWPAPDRRSS
jgi:hypothetical protein